MAFRKNCKLCENKVELVDYKDADLLEHYLTDRGKILPRRATGACSHHQDQVAAAIKRARYLALIPYISSYHR